MLEKPRTAEIKAQRGAAAWRTMPAMHCRHLLTSLAAAAACFAFTPVNAQFNAVAPTPAKVRPAVDQAYERLMAAPAVAALLEALKADHARSIEDLKLLTQIEAPPFKEQRRAEAFLARLKALGLDARIDA